MSNSKNKGKNKGKEFENVVVNGGEFADKIVYKPLEQLMHESMMPYSEFVIMDRALPRVEDGLKPVQRRVLYSMLEVGATPDKPYRKSARLVGDCMGKYHPHGDRSIYDTMVRMAQDFNMREILIDGHGNFGSVDGDSAAAMRYTEARLSQLSLELLKDIDKDTVTWSFNFDDSTKEPDMLPGRFPNLLVNGATGIAVGLATNIPTHNLSESIDAVVAYINNPKISLDEVMQIMPAPDFSTGGYLLPESEFKQVYETGKGKVVIRAKMHIENAENGRKNIVITELPYLVNKANLLQKIARLKENDTENKFAGISDIVDESDRNGTRAVIKLKRDANIALTLQQLYKSTELQVNFNANMVAIAGGKPKQMTLLEIIDYYVKYQREVVYRRTKYDLDVSLKREHILEGLLIAITNIDEVIRIIRAAKGVTVARQDLMAAFNLSEVQAQAILDMRLARLNNLEVTRLETELAELKVLIEKLRKILVSEKLQYNVVKQEMLEIKEKYGSPRKSEILTEEDDIMLELGEVDLDAVMGVGEVEHVIYSAGNTLKRVNVKNYNLSTKELSANPTLHEVPHIDMKIENNKTIFLFTNEGQCHKVKVSDIPVYKFKDRGEFIYNIVKNYGQNEKVVSMYELDESNAEGKIIFVTKQGLVKISSIAEYMSSVTTIGAIKLKDGDEVVAVFVDNGDQYLTIFSRSGNALTFDKSEVPEQGRMSQGVKGISLSDDDFVVGASQTNDSTAFTIITTNGFAKVIKQSEVSRLARARKGASVIAGTQKNLMLAYAGVLSRDINYVLTTNEKTMEFVINKKLSLENKQGKGKNVLTIKAKGIVVEEVYNYQTNE